MDKRRRRTFVRAGGVAVVARHVEDFAFDGDVGWFGRIRA